MLDRVYSHWVSKECCDRSPSSQLGCILEFQAHDHSHRNCSRVWRSSWPRTLSTRRPWLCQPYTPRSQIDMKTVWCTWSAWREGVVVVGRASRWRMRHPVLRCCIRRGKSFFSCCGNECRNRLGSSYFPLSWSSASSLSCDIPLGVANDLEGPIDGSSRHQPQNCDSFRTQRHQDSCTVPVWQWNLPEQEVCLATRPMSWGSLRRPSLHSSRQGAPVTLQR